MPYPKDFLIGFGLGDGAQLGSFVIKHGEGKHTKVAHGRYTYTFTLRVGGRGTDDELLRLINEKAKEHHEIKATVNWYRCSLNFITLEDIRDEPHEWIVTLRGNSYVI